MKIVAKHVSRAEKLLLGVRHNKGFFAKSLRKLGDTPF